MDGRNRYWKFYYKGSLSAGENLIDTKTVWGSSFHHSCSLLRTTNSNTAYINGAILYFKDGGKLVLYSPNTYSGTNVHILVEWEE